MESKGPGETYRMRRLMPILRICTCLKASHRKTQHLQEHSAKRIHVCLTRVIYLSMFIVAGEGCGGVRRDTSGWFSPVESFGERYEHNMDCQWFIQVDRHLRVHLNILQMDIQAGETCEFDFLQVSIPNGRMEFIQRRINDDALSLLHRH